MSSLFGGVLRPEVSGCLRSSSTRPPPSASAGCAAWALRARSRTERTRQPLSAPRAPGGVGFSSCWHAPSSADGSILPDRGGVLRPGVSGCPRFPAESSGREFLGVLALGSWIAPVAAAHGAIGGLRHKALLAAGLLPVRRGARLLPRSQRRARPTRLMSTAASASHAWLKCAAPAARLLASLRAPLRCASCAPSMACLAICLLGRCARPCTLASASTRAARQENRA